MIKQLITNELKDALGHEPSAAERKSALDYILGNIGDDVTLADIGMWLYDWRADCCFKCNACGEYFLEEEKQQHGMYLFTCGNPDCAESAEIARKFDARSEWGTY